MVRFFFGLRLYLAEICLENLESAKVPAQSKSGPGNNMIKRNIKFVLRGPGAHGRICTYFYDKKWLFL